MNDFSIIIFGKLFGEMQRSTNNEVVFVIETCQNCKQHFWNTRHDEQKYIDFFNKGKSKT